jgi:hypothetical protein
MDTVLTPSIAEGHCIRPLGGLDWRSIQLRHTSSGLSAASAMYSCHRSNLSETHGRQGVNRFTTTVDLRQVVITDGPCGLAWS